LVAHHCYLASRQQQQPRQEQVLARPLTSSPAADAADDDVPLLPRCDVPGYRPLQKTSRRRTTAHTHTRKQVARPRDSVLLILAEKAPLGCLYMHMHELVQLVTARRYASAVYAVVACLSVRLSQAGTVSKRPDKSSWFRHGGFHPPIPHCVVRKFG